MDFDKVNAKIGGCGRFQYLAFFLMTIPTFKQAIDFQGLTFALFEPEITCLIDRHINPNKTFQNASYVSIDQCQYKVFLNDSSTPCSKWRYNQRYMRSTIVSEYNLVCDRKYFRNWIYTLFFSGNLIAYPAVMISDKVGRRLPLIFSLFSSVVVTIIQIIFANLHVQFVCFFLHGVLRSLQSLSYPVLLEFVPTIKLDLVALNFWFFYCCGYMCTSMFAYLTGSWKMIYGLSLIPTVSYVLYFFFIPESPRWLMLKGRKTEAYKALSLIARINGKQLDKESVDSWKPTEAPTGRFWNLFKNRTMVGRLLILSVAAWSFSFAYIGCSTDLTFASDNIFVTSCFMGLIEFPTGPLASLFTRKTGRKKSISILCSVGIICLITTPFLAGDFGMSSWQTWLKVSLAMGGKLGFVSAWCILDLISNELMPTTDRNSAICIIYFFVSIGAIVAPQIHELALTIHHALPFLIYASWFIITVILILLFFPETKGIPLSQTLEESVSLKKGNESEWKMKMSLDAKKKLYESA